jgi:Zn-dependent peptidase ImmA (M78 family)
MSRQAWVRGKVGRKATGCRACKDLEKSLESRLSEYVAARSAAYYRVSTELAAYKNVEMQRAKSELEEHRLVCTSDLKVKAVRSTPLKNAGEM